MPGKTAIFFVLVASLFISAGCGYLDDDLFVDDEEFGGTFGSMSGTLHGSGWGSSSSCGVGIVRLGNLGTVGRPGAGSSRLAAKRISEMSDEELLEHTDIGVIDETPRSTQRVGTVQEAYHAQKAKRDEAILRAYSSPGD